ncbi:MAG: EthD domain-containing protein [Proteobacteria bacterium]|nr:EthD domain-containing protein [Pseudomonadota bacterium]
MTTFVHKLIAVVPPGDGPPDEIHSRVLRPPEWPGLKRYAANLADLDQAPIGGGQPCAAAVLCLWLDETSAALDWLEGLPAHAYRIDEKLQWDYVRDWPLGRRSPGFNQIAFVVRRGDRTRAEFARHWDEVHGPLARRHHPGIWRYVQNVVSERLTRGAPDWDGFAELHFRSLEDFEQRYFDSERGREILRADVAEFIDAPLGRRLLTSEYVIRVESAAETI